jgi:hypothetical protein
MWAAILILVSSSALGQTPASLRGHVTDPSGAAVPNATVHLINSASNSERTAVTDQTGSYLFAQVVPGTYSLRVDAQGFQEYEQDAIHVGANAPATINVQLKIAQVQQSVTVRPENGDRCLAAEGRVLPAIGPGLRALRRGPSGNYYVMTAPGAAVSVYSPDGKLVGQIPSQSSQNAPGSAIIYGSDMQVDTAGRVYVADRGANAIKIYSPAGVLVKRIHVFAPVSVEPLPLGEVAVASLSSEHLVDVYDAVQGDLDHSFGDLADVKVEDCNDDTFDCKTKINPQDVGSADYPTKDSTFTNHSWFYGDPAGGIYLDLGFRAIPTIRKYDGYGVRAYESAFPLDLSALSSGSWNYSGGMRVAGVTAGAPMSGSQSSSSSGSGSSTSTTAQPFDAPMAGGSGMGMHGGGMHGGGGGEGRGGGMEDRRVSITLQITQHAGPPDSKPVIDAIGADPVSQDLWFAIGSDLVHLDKDGNLAGYYCLTATDQAVPVTILIEPTRILVGYDPFGVIAYPRPDVESAH